MSKLTAYLNFLEQQILDLWSEGMMLEDIADKLNIDQDYVEDVVECEANYRNGNN